MKRIWVVIVSLVVTSFVLLVPNAALSGDITPEAVIYVLLLVFIPMIPLFFLFVYVADFLYRKIMDRNLIAHAPLLFVCVYLSLMLIVTLFFVLVDIWWHGTFQLGQLLEELAVFLVFCPIACFLNYYYNKERLTAKK